ncbi:MAG: hypothetical protein ACREQC_03850, partial [Candidatus Binataceae bacterium]
MTEEIEMASVRDAAGAIEFSATRGGLLEALAAPRRAIPLIAIFGAILFLLNLGGYPLYTKGEPREAVTVFNMLHGGGFILPLRAG